MDLEVRDTELLTPFSVFMPVPHWFAYYGFETQFEVRGVGRLQLCSSFSSI